MRKPLACTVLDLCSSYGVSMKTALDLVYGGALPGRRPVIRAGEAVRDEDIDYITNEIFNGTTILERIPSSVRSGLAAGSPALCAAELVCNGCPPTESESRPVYDTAGLEGEGLIQETLVEKWARVAGFWFEHPERTLAEGADLVDAGTESKVWFRPSEHIVYKAISLKYYNVLRPALDRIVIHNALFPDTAMTVLGFGRLEESGVFVIVVRQPYIVGTKPSEMQRRDHMIRLGFRESGMDFGMHLNYVRDDVYVGDVNEFNAILTPGGVSVIDADCRFVRPNLL